MAPLLGYLRCPPTAFSSLHASRKRLAFHAFILFTLLLLTTASAQSPPPGPQPGLGVNPNIAAAPTKTVDANYPTAAIAGGSITITPGAGVVAATPTASSQPQIVSTVTVINGTTTILIATVTGAPQAGGQQPPPFPVTTSVLPKAPQSILVVQSTTFGKILPAAGPVDDQMESHFWDQFVSRPDGTKKSSSPPLSPPSATSSLFLQVACAVIVGIIAIAMPRP